MTFRSLLDRTVTIVPRVVTGTDAAGNDVLTDGTPITGVAAGRDLEEAGEDLAGRDEQTRTFVYFLPAFTDDGNPLALTGYDRIVDTDGTFNLRGDPELVVRRRGGRPHHIEAIAYRITG